MGYRKQPFGYRMENGEIVIHSLEADVVKNIFRDYLVGMGFSSLTEKLNDQNVRYYPGKFWNKNMIARILGDARYTGEKDFPPIIHSDELAAVKTIRATRNVPYKVTQEQKILCRLVGQRTSQQLEQTLLCLMNRLIENPMLIQCPKSEQKPSVETITLKSQLDELLDSQPVDESKARPLIFQLAAAQYQGIGNEEFETVRLRDIFARMTPIRELDAGLLKETVAGISKDSNGKIQITLKNGQNFEQE